MNRPVLPAPPRAVVDGRCVMGTFNQPIKDLNLHALRAPLGFSAPSAWNRFRLKEWQAFQVSNEDWFICLAVYNTKSLGTAIIMAFNKREQRMYQYERKVPAWQLHVPNGLFNTRCYYRSRGLSIDIQNHLESNRIEVEFHASLKGLPTIAGAFTASHTTEPIVIVQPFADNRPLYSHKALMPVEGRVVFGDDVSPLRPDTSCVIMDDHKGFYPYVMQYDWVTALGIHPEKGLMGFNLTDNQIQDHDRFNENCLWLDGEMIPLPPIEVDRPRGVAEAWRIHDKNDRVALTFTPLADVPVNINAGLVKVSYSGPTGRFEGYIRDAAGDPICFDDFVGMGEKKHVRM